MGRGDFWVRVHPCIVCPSTRQGTTVTEKYIAEGRNWRRNQEPAQGTQFWLGHSVEEGSSREGQSEGLWVSCVPPTPTRC